MCRAELVFRLVYFTGIFCLLYATDTLPNQQNTPYPSRSSERYGGVLLMDADRDRGGDTFPKHPAVLPSASRYIAVFEIQEKSRSLHGEANGTDASLCCATPTDRRSFTDR